MTAIFGRLPGAALFLALSLAAIFASPAHALGPADGPGCIAVPLNDCLTWLRTVMRLDESSLASSLARRHQTDVNGRPLGGGVVTVSAKLPGEVPGQTDVFTILLHLQADDIVVGADASLTAGLVTADTEPQYDKSALYPLVWRLVGRRCPSLAKLETYRLFQNQVKPRLSHERQDLSSGLAGLHRILSHSPPVPFCGGVSLSYTNRVQWRGGQDPEAAAKLEQFSYIELR